ncbi:MAG: hypothetical protein E7672_05180 [Ruminococcaceae bacterium]|nr:hypothetical protein [Oscillospiraceae bacterium]
MRKKHSYFPLILIIYILILAILSTMAVLYVRSLLKTYENAQPEIQVKVAISALASEAESGALWDKFASPLVAGKFESDLDIKEEYKKLISSDSVEFSTKAGLHEEDELVYSIKNNGMILGEVTLKAVGEPVSKLAVFTWREWKIKEILPIFASQDYTLTVPSDFSVTVNGIELVFSDVSDIVESQTKYSIEGLYFPPNLRILDSNGVEAEYSIKGKRIIPVIYDYTLTLPSTLEVKLNGEVQTGEPNESGYISYDIRLLTKPEVIISDMFGNTVNYEGGNTLPLTYLTLNTTDRHTVTVDGQKVPEGAYTISDNEEYQHFAEYTSGLPKLMKYNIAVLKDNADITIKDMYGETIEWDKTLHTLDLTALEGVDTVPSDIASEIDVLAIAEKWSLFVSKDLAGTSYGFYDIAQHLIPSSYQYDIARKYSTSIDITFTSIHTLGNPPFTDESVSNFVMLTDNCFSVDIFFNKHMILSSGPMVDNMNERFYFVKYDDPSSSTDSLTWRIASMKEIVGNAE